MQPKHYTQLSATMLVLIGSLAALAQTEFTYQGQLKLSNAPADGLYDFRFRLFDSLSGGTQVGTTVFADGWPVDDGLLTVSLDFGQAVFTGSPRWLQIDVRPSEGSGAYTELAPRQALTAVPYAMYAFSGPGGAGGFWAASGAHIFNLNNGRVGIGTSAPEAPLHVFSGSAGTVTAHSNSIAAFERSGNGYLSILTPSANERGLLFGDPTSFVNGGILYNSGNVPNGFQFRTAINTTRMVITEPGNVGIGTNSPTAKLHVQTTGEMVARLAGGQVRIVDGPLIVDGPFGGGATNHSASIYTITDGDALRAINDGDGRGAVFAARAGNAIEANNGGTGNGLFVSNSGGGRAAFLQSTSTNSNLSAVRVESHSSNNSVAAIAGVNLGSGRGVSGYGLAGGAGVFGEGTPGILGVATSATSYGGMFSGSGNGPALLAFGDAHLAGKVSVGTTSVPAGVLLNVAGTTRTAVLEITGADLAERFPTHDTHGAEPGTVMEIDPQNPGHLRIAQGAYNRRVAGVVSGAGDLPVGAILGNLPGSENSPAIALSGRVWVRCDAREHSIAPGDMLTTSDLAGHAMKVTNLARAQGASLGKAMTCLEHGKTGLVLVLVSLQ